MLFIRIETLEISNPLLPKNTMSKIIIVLASLCGLAIAGVFYLIATTPPPPAPVVKKESASTSVPDRSSRSEISQVTYEATPARTVQSQPAAQTPKPTSTGIYSQSSAPSSERDRVTESIFEAVSTYSPAGVSRIKPMLQSPDEEIRASAIEGMRQIGLPEAAAALREAAQRGTTRQEDREEMLEAAEFIELPNLVKSLNQP
jgi:hypothetical protein